MFNAMMITAGVIIGLFLGAFLVVIGKELLIAGLEKIEDWYRTYRHWKWKREQKKNK